MQVTVNGELLWFCDETWCQCYEPVYEIIWDIMEISTIQEDNG